MAMRIQFNMEFTASLLKCVCFIGFRLASGEMCVCGTGFYVGRRIKAESETAIVYVLTAKHVIENIRARFIDRVFIRTNERSGECAWYETALEDWFCSEELKNLDICASAIGPTPEMDFLWIEIPAQTISAELPPIQLGELVYFPGLFSERPGVSKNIPVLRTGTIAALPEESFKTRVGGVEAYLIEARSIGGHSGSPVFVNQNGYLRLLGIVHGHFGERLPQAQQTCSTCGSPRAISESQPENWINFGIAIVLPTESIVLLLEDRTKRRFSLSD
jgi:hypothetical protein